MVTSLAAVRFNVHHKVKSTGFQPVSFSHAYSWPGLCRSHQRGRKGLPSAGSEAGGLPVPCDPREPTYFSRWLFSGKNFDGSKKVPSKYDAPTLQELGLFKNESEKQWLHMAWLHTRLHPYQRNRTSRLFARKQGHFVATLASLLTDGIVVACQQFGATQQTGPACWQQYVKAGPGLPKVSSSLSRQSPCRGCCPCRRAPSESKNYHSRHGAKCQR